MESPVVGPFEILERIGRVAYWLAFSVIVSRVQCSHVSVEAVCVGPIAHCGL